MLKLMDCFMRILNLKKKKIISSIVLFFHVSLIGWASPDSLLNLIVSYQGQDLQKNIQAVDSLLNIAISQKNEQAILEGNRQLGKYWVEKKNFVKGIEHYLTAMKLANKLKDTLAEAKTSVSLGMIHASQRNYSDAERYCRKALELASYVQFPLIEIIAASNLGAVFEAMNQFDSSILYHKRSLEVARQFGDTIGIGSALHNLGWAHNNQKKYTEARKYYRASVPIFEALKDERYLGISYLNLGDLAMKEGEFREAEAHLKKAIQLSGNPDYADTELEASERLAAVYARQGNYPQAYQYMTRARFLVDTLFDKQQFSTIQELQESFEAERRENEIAMLASEKQVQELKLSKTYRTLMYTAIAGSVLLLLSAAIVWLYIKVRRTNMALHNANEALAQSEADLLKLNTSKDRFFQIISHDLRGPMQGIRMASQLLQLQGYKMDAATLKQVAGDLYQSADAQHTLLNNLLLWAGSQSGYLRPKFAVTEFAAVVNQSVAVINPAAIQRQINITTNIQEDINSKTDADMLNTILRNLLANAVKHSPPGTDILITGNILRNEIVLRIKDNGPGMTDEQVKQLLNDENKPPEQKTEQGEYGGLGWALIRDLTQHLNGRIDILSQPNEGTEVTLYLPAT
jgi:signal transduction histidine kinase